MKRWLFLFFAILLFAVRLSADTLTSAVCAGGTSSSAGCAVITSSGFGTVGIQITGTFVGTLSFEATNDDTNWVVVSAYKSTAPTTAVTTTTTTGLYSVPVAGIKRVRVRFSAFTSGSAVVTNIRSDARLSLPGGGGGDPFDQSLNTTDSPTFGGVTVRGNPGDAVLSVEESGAGKISLFDLAADDESTAYLFRFWNKAYSADPLDGFTYYQSDNGQTNFVLAANGSGGALQFGTAFSALDIIDQNAVQPGKPGFDSTYLPGFTFDSHRGEIFGFAEQGTDPSPPSVANVGTPGAATVSYKIVGVYYGLSLYPNGEFTSAASAAGTTNTAHATLDGTNFNRVTFTWPVGYSAVRVYRTAGGPSQGLIAEVSEPTLDDTGLAGDAATPPATNTTGNVLFAVDTGKYFYLNHAGDFRVVGGTIRAGGYKSSDGSTGFTGTACTAFKDGLCVSGT